MKAGIVLPEIADTDRLNARLCSSTTCNRNNVGYLHSNHQNMLRETLDLNNFYMFGENKTISVSLQVQSYHALVEKLRHACNYWDSLSLLEAHVEVQINHT